MTRRLLFTLATMAILVTAILSSSACTNNAAVTANTTKPPLKPKPRVVSVVQNTSGTESQYYVTLDIKVKNDGAEGVVLVIATVTQGSAVRRNEEDIYCKQGATQELKLTFPLIWKGGDVVSDVQAVVP